MTNYKFLTSEFHGSYSGFDFTPYLPRDGKPGADLPKALPHLLLDGLQAIRHHHGELVKGYSLRRHLYSLR